MSTHLFLVHRNTRPTPAAALKDAIAVHEQRIGALPSTVRVARAWETEARACLAAEPRWQHIALDAHGGCLLGEVWTASEDAVADAMPRLARTPTQTQGVATWEQ